MGIPRPRVALAVGGAALIALAGCGEGPRRDGRPLAKPAQLVTVLQTDSGGMAATVATRTGEILVRDLDGRVRRLPLSSADGRAALAESEAAITAAASGRGSVSKDKLTTQERMEAQFEARSYPALPPVAEQAEGARTGRDRSQFIGSMVVELAPRENGQTAAPSSPAGAASGDGMRLVEATVNLKQGVDADTAFAYATCALAGWAKEHGVPYARHIRTLQQRANGRLRVASVFTLSRQPPMGLSVVEAQTTLAECRARGIPAT